MNKIIFFFNQKIFKKLGFSIRRPYVAFSMHHDLSWLLKFNVRTIFDVGANTGQFAQFANSLFPEAQIYSFEPIKECFEKVKNIKNRNIKAFNFALGDVNDKLDFFLNEFTPSSSLLKISETSVKNFPFTQKQKLTEIEVKKLDDLIEDLNIQDEVLVKIDVQGFEDKVLKGAYNFLQNHVKILWIETSIRKLYEDEPSFEQVFHTLTKLGFEYKGNIDQLYSPLNGEILQVDSIFVRE